MEANIRAKKCLLPGKLEIDGIYTLFCEKPLEGYVFEGEYHDFWESVFVLNGSIRVTAGTDIFVLEKGQGVVHPPMEFHALRSLEPGTVYCVFSFDGTMPFEGHIVGQADVDVISEIHRLGRQAFDFYNNTGIWANEIKSGGQAIYTVKKLEGVLAEMYFSGSEEKVRLKTDKNYSVIVNALRKNIHRKLTLEELADICKMSPSNVKKVFGKYSGTGVMNYFNLMKVNKAKNLLREGFSVGEIAEKLGFADANYFSTVFKRIAGISPQEYKKNL